MNPIKLFVSYIRQKRLDRRINREIFQRIFPHIHNLAKYGYPFGNKDEMTLMQVRERRTVVDNLSALQAAAAQMPKAYGDAFNYAVSRELNQQLEMYLLLAEKRIQPKSCDPRLVATPA